MMEKLYGISKKAVAVLMTLISIMGLIHLLGHMAYIAVPFIVSAGLVAYTLRDINRKKTHLKKVPDWETYVREHDDSHVRKFYQRDTREIHNRSGRQKHREARQISRHR